MVGSLHSIPNLHHFQSEQTWELRSVTLVRIHCQSWRAQRGLQHHANYTIRAASAVIT